MLEVISRGGLAVEGSVEAKEVADSADLVAVFLVEVVPPVLGRYNPLNPPCQGGFSVSSSHDRGRLGGVLCYNLSMEIKDVENLAELAKIDLNEDEKKQILKDMGGILEYVKTIESVKLDETKPEYDTYNVWREDKIGPQEFSRESIIKQFPDEQDNFLKVKKIL